MKKAESPFNPVLLPDLALPAVQQQPMKPEPKPSRKKAAPRKSARIARTRRVVDLTHAPVHFAVKVHRRAMASLQRIELGIATRLARLDRDKLKRVLLACGIAGTVAVLIIAVAKLTPLLVALLALLGLETLLRMWDRLRLRPI